MEITIYNKKFELDIDAAKSAGALKLCREPITTVNVGDVFVHKDSMPIVLLKAIWQGPYDTNLACYSFGGLYGLKPFSNYEKLMTLEKVVKHLNSEGYVYIGNINDDVSKAIDKLRIRWENENS